MIHLRRSRTPGSRAGRRPTSRRTLAALAGLAVVATTTLVGSGAEAATFGPYTIDGTVPGADGGQQLDDPVGNVKELGPKNASTTKISVIHTAATPMLDLTNPNAQVDLKTAWLDLERQSGSDFLYFAWERETNTGSGFIAFEFMKNGLPSGCATYAVATCNPWKSGTEAGGVKVGRSAGDFMILWDQSGSSAVLSKRTWTQASANAPLVLGAPQMLPPSQASGVYSADKTRGEAAINLTAANLTDGSSCTTFANVIPSTVTGNSDTADYKDTILKKIDPLSSCTPSIVTTPTNDAGDALGSDGISIGTGSATVRDSALVSLTGGNATPTGSVAFSLCKVDAPGVCGAGEGVDIGTTALNGAGFPATVLSPPAHVTAAGRYCWRSTWSGDAANGIPAASDSSSGECFVVTPVTPTLSTQASTTVNLGGKVSDTATLGGTARQPADPAINTSGDTGALAGGSIVFTLYGPSDTACGPLVYTSSPVSVSGNGSYPSPEFTPTATGSYHWVASYSGDGPNTLDKVHNADCKAASESVSVTDVPVSMTTAQSWVPNDSVTLTAPAGTGNLVGTASFALYSNGTCTGTPIYSTTKPVSGASPQTVSSSNTTAQTATGTFSWKVGYDSTNLAQRDIIPGSCHETSALTVANGGTVSSP